MVAVFAELTQQNQDLTREVHRKKHRRHQRAEREELEQNPGERRAKSYAKGENQSRGTITWRVPHLEREVDQMKIAMREMKDFMRRRIHKGDLIHKTHSPLIASITTHPLPSKFKIPTLDSYDGTRDPCDHIVTFKSSMPFQGAKPFLQH